MDDETRAVLRDTVIREAAGLLVLCVIVWAIGPGRMQFQRAAHRARAAFSPRDPFEGEVRRFASEVSRWDHEQAARTDQ